MPISFFFLQLLFCFRFLFLCHALARRDAILCFRSANLIALLSFYFLAFITFPLFSLLSLPPPIACHFLDHHYQHFHLLTSATELFQSTSSDCCNDRAVGTPPKWQLLEISILNYDYVLDQIAMPTRPRRPTNAKFICKLLIVGVATLRFAVELPSLPFNPIAF